MDFNKRLCNSSQTACLFLILFRRRIESHLLRCRHQRHALLKKKRSRARNDCRQRLRWCETEHEVKRQVLRISCEPSPAPNYLGVASLSQSPLFTHRHLGGGGGTCTRLSVREGIISVAAERVSKDTWLGVREALVGVSHICDITKSRFSRSEGCASHLWKGDSTTEGKKYYYIIRSIFFS